jgi:hypothetical protein
VPGNVNWRSSINGNAPIIGQNQQRDRSEEFRNFLDTIEKNVASWLNLVEPWFALLSLRQLRRGVHRSTKELKAAIDTFIQIHNRDPKPFVWHKTADQILDSVARICK